ncbi:hypothetical protein CLV48_1244 [Cecembia rubra]|uniref:Uncharacterized protein n=1 Tax=Cecembia rubra TaxID=1485585 RepID=A0A2P8DI67_9BACT|nr:hypothetical protein CLV48_1244 [Cecembia rubra]
MVRYQQLSLADLRANTNNILFRGSIYGIFLKELNASKYLDKQSKIFFLDGILSGNSLQYVNHLKPVMVLNKSNRL